jgi:hypothetical protein
MPAWSVESPFTRPLGFWLFDATEPRIRVYGKQQLEAVEKLKTRGADFRLCYFESLNDRLGFPSTRPERGEYETEKQYLCRLNLLFDSERELL